MWGHDVLMLHMQVQPENLVTRPNNIRSALAFIVKQQPLCLAHLLS